MLLKMKKINAFKEQHASTINSIMSYLKTFNIQEYLKDFENIKQRVFS